MELKYKVGDLVCSKRNPRRRFKILAVAKNSYTILCLGNDKTKLIGTTQEHNWGVVEEYTRHLTKLERALS